MVKWSRAQTDLGYTIDRRAKEWCSVEALEVKLGSLAWNGKEEQCAIIKHKKPPLPLISLPLMPLSPTIFFFYHSTLVLFLFLLLFPTNKNATVIKREDGAF